MSLFGDFLNAMRPPSIEKLEVRIETLKEIKWNRRMLDLAEHIAQWSKDPSTKCGAVVADSLHRVRGVGYNGFPRGVCDNPSDYADREHKLKSVVHAEVNALINSAQPINGCALYVWPMPSCHECAKLIIQMGIAKVVSPMIPEDKVPMWEASAKFGAKLMRAAGIHVVLI